MEVVNEVLSELNEVQLTQSNFSAAKNIQNYVKLAVNRAYFDVNNPEFKWPWLAVAESQNEFYGNTYVETTAGTRWYLLNPAATEIDEDYNHVDWDNITLTTEGVAGATTPYDYKNLKYLPIGEWKERYALSELRDKGGEQVYGKPLRIFKNPDNRRFGLSPIPDGTYRIYFYAWDRPDQLVNYNDPINIPSQYFPVLVARARYFAWQRKENPSQAALALEDYLKGLRGMRQQELEASPSHFSDDRVRFK